MIEVLLDLYTGCGKGLLRVSAVKLTRYFVNKNIYIYIDALDPQSSLLTHDNYALKNALDTFA